MKEAVLYFPDSSATPDILDVGEKGVSLFHLAKAGLEVPAGFILTVDFFKSWIEVIEALPEWQTFASLPPEKMWGNTSVMEKIPALVLSEEQKNAIEQALRTIKAPLVALRPSLADPIIHGNSFADRYETHLAVAPENACQLLERIFRSCMDPRIYMIQKKRGLENIRIRIAMIIQTQIFSESSGSIYSVHPRTNDYDQAMVESVWGLGDYLADGAVEPDRYSLDKVGGEVLEAALGSKRVTSWLNFQKVVERRPEWKHGQFSLTRDQIQSLHECLRKAELHYTSPVKVDWCLAAGKIYVLQASPYASIIRLPSKFQSSPGENRHVYLNLTATFFGMQRPFSHVSSDFYARSLRAIIRRLVGDDLMAECWERLVSCWHGGVFLDVTLLRTYFGSKLVLSLVSKIDPLSAQKLVEMGFEQEPPSKRLSCGRFSTTIRIIVRNPSLPLKILGALLFPKLAYAGMKREALKLQRLLQNRSLEKMSLEKATEKLTRYFSLALVRTFLPSFIASHLAKYYLRRTFQECSQEHWKMSEYLRCLSLYHPQIGSRIFPLELHYLSRLVQVEQISSEAELIQLIHREGSSSPYKQAWSRILERFGKKGPGMVDLGTPRFAEEPFVLLPSIFHFLKASPSTLSPQEIYDRTDRLKRSTPTALKERAAVQFWPEIGIVSKAAAAASLLSCSKEWSEASLSELLFLIRLRLLEAGSHFATYNRLEKREQIFHLSLSQIDHALSNPQADLRDMLVQSGTPLPLLPRLIDSRGHIFHNEFASDIGKGNGVPISPGKARGRARFLESYRPQDFVPGEILVVASLDSSWAPIVVTAAALIVESGGQWNPGVRLAMEYNIPCITGVLDITNQIHSGDYLEVDGEKGIYKKIAPLS